MKRKNTFNICLCAVCVVFIAAGALASFPLFGSKFTLQTLAVCVVGYLLGAKWGTACTAVYIILGLIGVPVFAGFHSGPAVLFGNTGGFIFGFIPLALLCGLAYNKSAKTKLLFGFSGVIICHIAGVLQFSFIYKQGLISAILLSCLPFLLKDLLSVAAAVFISQKYKNIFNSKIHYYIK